MILSKRFLIGIIIFCSCAAFSETESHDKIWAGAVVVGSLSADQKIKYYLQPQLGLIDDKYKFQNTFFYAGIGYRPEAKITYWLMNGYDTNKGLKGTVSHRYIIREQLNYLFIDNDLLSFANISRLEERKDLAESEWAFRIREMLTVRLPFKNWEGHSLAMFNETFFNINHPAWINSNTLVEQNRTFIGIGTKITKNSLIDIGYLKQYQFKKTDANNNVFYIYFNMLD